MVTIISTVTMVTMVTTQITRNDTERKAELLFRQYGTVEITVILYDKFDVMQVAHQCT